MGDAMAGQLRLFRLFLSDWLADGSPAVTICDKMCHFVGARTLAGLLLNIGSKHETNKNNTDI